MTKEQICQAIVERTVYYGSKTMKRLNRWFRKNHDPILGHSDAEAYGAVGSAVKELNKYKRERVKDLMRFNKSDLERLSRYMSKRVLEQRYGSNHIDEKDLPEIVLEGQRQILIEKNEIKGWLKASKKQKRKTPPVVKPEPVKVKRAKVKVNTYLANMRKFNEVLKPNPAYKPNLLG